VEAVSWFAFYIYPKKPFGFDIEEILLWVAIDPWEPMPLFVISAIGTSMAVTILSISVADRFKDSRLIITLSSLGQLTFTLYVTHILLGSAALLIIEIFNWKVYLFTLWGAGLFYAIGLFFAYQWRKYHEKGPMEWAMRRFAQYSIRPKKRTLVSTLPSTHSGI
jgi:uncharacterized membrane protein YeiB